MLENLPQQYRQDPTVRVLDKSIESILMEQGAEARTIPAQLSLDTVTWNLPVEERLAGIMPVSGTTLDSRRTALKAKWRSGGRLTIEQVQAVCDAWKNGKVEASFTSGKIFLKFVGSYGIPADLDALKAAVRLVIPAHLPLDYGFAYLLIRDIDQTMTIDTLQARPISEFAF